jgi:hypothetical protein
VGTALKRTAVRLWVKGFKYPVSLPNQFTGEELMTEIKGVVDPAMVARAAIALIDDASGRGARAARLHATMPHPGAAERLVRRVYAEIGWPAPPAPINAPADAAGAAAGGAGRA